MEHVADEEPPHAVHGGEIRRVAERRGHAHVLQHLRQAHFRFELEARHTQVDLSPHQTRQGLRKPGGIHRRLDGFELARVREDDVHRHAAADVGALDDLVAVALGVAHRLNLVHHRHGHLSAMARAVAEKVK